MPFAVFWMHAYFVNMPDETSEAARVDGATMWNQFLIALVLVEDLDHRTMAGALGAFLILLPTLIIFVLFQRQIITALLQGSVTE
jgi:raffinose/stachyose/melibiose transport system permease protein